MKNIEKIYLKYMDNKQVLNLKNATLDLIKVELMDYGIDPEQIFFKERIEIEDHLVDMQKFVEKTNWSKPNYQMRCYTVDYGYVVFLPTKEFYDEFRNNETLEEECDLLRKEVDSIINNFIKCYLDEVRELSESKILSERISPSLKNNYQITDSLSDVLNWKVKVVIGNSRNEKDPDVGDYDSVGYVHVGINLGTIVPIARADEHHRGYDLVQHLIEKGLIPSDTYYPFFCINNDYVDRNDQIALQAMKIWRKLGGPNITIRNWRNDGTPFQLTMDEFIEKEGNIEINKGELFPFGQKLIDQLKEVSSLCIESRTNPLKEKQLYAKSVKTYLFYVKNIDMCSESAVQEMLSKIENCKIKGGDQGIKDLEQLFFGFDSFKNNLHNQIRKALDPKSYSFEKRDMIQIFGDLELANHLLSSL